MNPLPRVNLPGSFNYIGVFLTFRCPYHCSYCINRHRGASGLDYREIAGDDWIAFFRRLHARDVPITLQGGEPGCHPDFIKIVRETLEFHPVDLLTNLAFDLDQFIAEVDPAKMNRTAPYAPIRVSFHPGQFTLDDIMGKTLFLMDAGFRVGLYGVLHPNQLRIIENARRICLEQGIDFRTKPFLGMYQDVLHGDYAYPEACAGPPARKCECAPSELLIAPDGTIHRCHLFCYNRYEPLARITDEHLQLTDDYLPCAYFGLCNPCDVKVKNNRFQQFGHVAARIRNTM